MRTDVKSGMIGGTILCIIGIVWFCIKQQVIRQPLIKIEPQSQISSEAESRRSSANKIRTYEPAKTPASGIGIVHTVTQGQTLSDISKIYYNSSGGWKKIYEANKGQFPRGPDIIRPGMRLVIPQ